MIRKINKYQNAFLYDTYKYWEETYLNNKRRRLV